MNYERSYGLFINNVEPWVGGGAEGGFVHLGIEALRDVTCKWGLKVGQFKSWQSKTALTLASEIGPLSIRYRPIQNSTGQIEMASKRGDWNRKTKQTKIIRPKKSYMYIHMLKSKWIIIPKNYLSNNEKMALKWPKKLF